MTLRVTVEVVPGGREPAKRTIATIDISNVSELSELSNYEATARLDGHGSESIRARVEGHRRSTGWIPLVRRVLESVGGSPETPRKRSPEREELRRLAILGARQEIGGDGPAFDAESCAEAMVDTLLGSETAVTASVIEKQRTNEARSQYDGPKPGTLYRHYKGGHYRVLAIARLSEERGKSVVVYESLEKGEVWVRPLADGIADAWLDKKRWPDGVIRGRFIEETSAPRPDNLRPGLADILRGAAQRSVDQRFVDRFQQRPANARLDVWKRCLMPSSGLQPTDCCDKTLTEWPDLSWRCPDGHYNSPDQLRREALGRLVREVWISWARDQDAPKPHHLLPWEALSNADQEVDRRIGETLLGIRDWRKGHRLPSYEERGSPVAPCAETTTPEEVMQIARKVQRDERAAAVKWLRGAAEAIDEQIGIRGYEGASAARHAADAIERGDHVSTDEKGGAT